VISVMLKAIMIVRPQRAEILCQRLLAAGWMEELEAVECRGYGRQKGHLEQYEGAEYTIDFLPKVEISGFLLAERSDELIDLVCSTCRTGRIGDGKIFLSKVGLSHEF
jgi:nitrogen regulatory protein P-II 1